MIATTRPPHTVDLRQRAREWIEGFHEATEDDRVNCVALLLCAADDAYDCAAEDHKRKLADPAAPVDPKPYTVPPDDDCENCARMEKAKYGLLDPRTAKDVG